MRKRWRLVLAAVGFVVAVRLGVAADPALSLSREVQLQLGDLLFAEARYTEAADAYTRAKGSTDPHREFRAVSGLVKSLLRVAEFDRAMREAVALKAMASRNPEALALYGDSLWASGFFEEAETVFRDGLALQPDHSRSHHGLARAVATRSRPDEAMGHAQAALRLSPREAEFHHTVGSLYERMHRFEEAAIAFGNYVNLLPNKDRSDKAAWSRAEIRFLRSFGRRVPYEIEGVEEGAPILHTIPFRLVRDKVIVKGSINGGQTTEFVLDTGAEETVISRRTAQRFGVSPIVYTLSAGVGEVGLRGLQVGRLDTLQVGTLKVNNVPCLIKNPPLNDMPSREGESFSPLALGLSMTIDYGRRQLTIGRKLPAETVDMQLPLRLYRLAMVRGLVNKNNPVNFVVDTGGEVISISAATASMLAPTTTRRIPLKVYGTSGWDRDAFLLPGVDLQFDQIRFPNFPVVVLNLQAPSALLGFQVGGIVGHKFLSKYRVGIDLENSTLKLTAP